MGTQGSVLRSGHRDAGDACTTKSQSQRRRRKQAKKWLQSLTPLKYEIAMKAVNEDIEMRAESVRSIMNSQKFSLTGEGRAYMEKKIKLTQQRQRNAM